MGFVLENQSTLTTIEKANEIWRMKFACRTPPPDIRYKRKPACSIHLPLVLKSLRASQTATETIQVCGIRDTTSRSLHQGTEVTDRLCMENATNAVSRHNLSEATVTSLGVSARSFAKLVTFQCGGRGVPEPSRKMDTALTGNFHERGLSSLQARGRPDRFTLGKRTLKQRSAAEATSYPWGGNWGWFVGWRRVPGGKVGSAFLPAWRDNGTHCRLRVVTAVVCVRPHTSPGCEVGSPSTVQWSVRSAVSTPGENGKLCDVPSREKVADGVEVFPLDLCYRGAASGGTGTGADVEGVLG
ncbi:hypothetical protein E1301_Tti008218 [Triplophysa tibetana]|uniref:Uncharacterized protein n=1 Tax=Triplophysa tibetana TaxID=1572043 RepID=A0A5A9PEP8_9TELE|nr:hypothetical protein E1301_Tti008218 [Triplophysa tibetana]